LLEHLDLGILYHYTGRYDSSLVEFEKAIALHDELFTKSVSNEALSLLTNDNVRPYRGKAHEIVLMHLFQAFNYLALGKSDEALVEARQTQLFLTELKRKEGEDAKAYTDDGLFRFISALAYENSGEKDDALISLFQSVKAFQKSGEGIPPSLQRYASQSLSSNGRDEDVAMLKLTNTGKANENDPRFRESEIVLVGESGKTASIGQTVFWGTWVRDGALVIHYEDENGKTITEALPAPGLPQREYEKANKGRRTQSGTTFHIKFTLPAFKKVDSRTRKFALNISGQPTAYSESYANIDELLKKYLDESHTSILTRTVIRVVLRTIASEQTKSSLRTDNPIVNLLVNIGTDVLADQLEQADTRNWFLLPKSIQIARLPVKPGTYSVTAGAQDGNGTVLKSQVFDGITVKPGEKKFLFMTSWQ
jgi:tetratricopeptide (TPR) repeat protein